MRKVILISVLFLSFACKGQSVKPSCNWDSLAIQSIKAIDLKFAKRIEDLEMVNSIREGNEAIYESQLLLIEGLKSYRHYGLTHFMFGYAHYIKGEIKKQKEILFTINSHQQFYHN